MRKENPTPDFVSLEKEVLKFWDDQQCFKKLMDQNIDGERFAFLDGPITANNPMGIHHAWGRTLKDMYIKYNSMQGKSCQFQNGFDAQGLWVEVEVEKEIGIKAKSDIINYGLDKFTEKCIDRVNKFSRIITEQSKRLGQWMDWENSYFTNTDLNITSIWHFLKKCNEKGWLAKSNRPMPWCPRCGTSLSEHEMSGSYSDMEHLSIYGKAHIVNTNESILFWTTTPWTLTSNVALAVNQEIEYVRVTLKDEARSIVIIGKGALNKLKGDILSVSEPFKGASLIGLEYITCFDKLECQNFPHRIVHWGDVEANEGTGVVHIAPGCGAEDFELGKKLGLPVICPINDEGIIIDGFGVLSGKSTADISEEIVEILKADGKLYKTEMYTHSYPKCWRCKTPVVFKLVDEWNITSAEIRPLMIDACKTVNWEPDFAGKRMIDWLTNMGDWNISRKRFYGLPLPFYPCKKCGHINVIGSKEELRERSNDSLESVPHLHRPYIDKIKIKCEKCAELTDRILEVGDCWLDAGIAPFSTKKYFQDKEYFKKNFPSELVIEMKEQIRLWFYSILFMSVTLEGVSPYKNVVAHSSVINEEGGKFSKTGYMIKFDDAAEEIGADPIRYLFASAPVAGDVRFGNKLTDEARRKMLGLWNVYIFFNIYASLDNPDIANYKPSFNDLHITDKWLLIRTDEFLNYAKNAYSTYRATSIVKEFESYIDDVSNWYIRINRKRFWKTIDKNDQYNAYWCLYRAIKVTLGIMSPIIPFITDYIWQNTVREIEKNSPISVHLSKFPVPLDDLVIDSAILSEAIKAREIITTGQNARNQVQIKVKQPLKTLYIYNLNGDIAKFNENYGKIIRDELNVKNIEFTNDKTKFYDPLFKVNFSVAGAVLKGEVQKLKIAVDNLTKNESIEFDKQYNNGLINIAGFVNLKPELFDKLDVTKENYIVSVNSDYVLALDLNLDEKLIEEGLVRELIRQIQILRKDSGFAVEQRIKIQIDADTEFAERAINTNADKICQDVLATKLCKLSKFDTEKSYELHHSNIVVKLKKTTSKKST
ncbi:MAG: isoleucine--tRNA ligase [Christensenellaceae bacterium]|jgi:isoleucyl-tRNA synthetase|nr:isoleucine--tRNA ligase [Christensenellaceae bacterium]